MLFPISYFCLPDPRHPGAPAPPGRPGAPRPGLQGRNGLQARVRLRPKRLLLRPRPHQGLRGQDAGDLGGVRQDFQVRYRDSPGEKVK